MLQRLTRLLTLLLAGILLMTPILSCAEMPEPTISPDAEPYDASKPELLEENQLAATSALVMEESTGEIIFEKNIDARLYPASTTKIMTVLLGILTCEMDEQVTVSWNAVNVGDENATMLGLKEGEVIVMEDLLYGTLLRSGNDGANAIAEHVSGSVESFVNLMNETARQLNMTNTHFVNPHGLHDPNHYSSARDLAILARHAMSNEAFRQIANTRNYTLAETNMQPQRSIKTRHRIMDKDDTYYYAPMTGVKSGSHSQAAYCYVGSASRDGIDLISVVLYSGRYTNATDTKKLMEYGFSQYKAVSVIDLYNEYPITIVTSGYALDDRGLGELELEAVATDVNPLLTIRVGDEARYAKNLYKMVQINYTREKTAPIMKGETMGVMTFIHPDTGQTVNYNLLAKRSIPERKDRPLTLEEIIAMTEADDNPMPPITTEVVLIFLSPYFVAGLVVLLLFLLHRSYKRLYARLPKNSNRYVK